MEKEIPTETEAVLVIGGDGTLIRAARNLVKKNIPLLGINLGKLGYLCEVEENTIFPAIDELMADRYTIEQRMLLDGYTVQSGGEKIQRVALNDVVIHRTGALQIVNLNAYVNGEYLYNLRRMESLWQHQPVPPVTVCRQVALLWTRKPTFCC